MMRVGLTGGIGSGKSTVGRALQELGIPVYDSDRRARELMEGEERLRAAITELLGPGAYKGTALNRPFIASRVFDDPAMLDALNALVHPVVRADFEAWAERQAAPYVVQEAAVLFENGGYRGLDRMILVTAPEDERIRRVMLRDGVSREAVRSRMRNQWEDAEKIPLADFVIRNTDLQKTLREAGKVHRELLQLAGNARNS
jgi:dephospho-CoA kinase